MRHAIIHIGTMKTGTTSIQRVLRKYRSELLEQGVCYARSPGMLAHVKLYGLLAHRKAAARGNPAAAVNRGLEIEKFPEEFASEMTSLPASVGRVILSEERLSLARSQGDLEMLQQFLAPYFDRFSVVVYLRSQDSYLASRYSELLRMRVLDGPDHVVATPERLSHYEYDALIARWATVFGEASIVPRIYERGAGADFDSVDDFLHVCALTLDVPAADPSRSRNQSMSFAGQQLMLRMGALVRETTGASRIGEDLWDEIRGAVNAAAPGRGWLPTRDEAAAFMARFEAANERVRERYFPERPRLFADGSARFPVTPMAADTPAMFDAACRAFLKTATEAETLRSGKKELRSATKTERAEARLQQRRAGRTRKEALLFEKRSKNFGAGLDKG